MVVCLELGAGLHTAQLMPLALTVSCFAIIQIGFTFLELAYPGSPGKRAVKRVCVCVCLSGMRLLSLYFTDRGAVLGVYAGGVMLRTEARGSTQTL